MEISNLPLTVKIIYEPEAKSAPYVAYSPEFEIASCGPTEEKARKNLREAVELVIEVSAKDGTLDELLESAGFTVEEKGWRLPKISFEPFSFPLPEPLQGRVWLNA